MGNEKGGGAMNKDVEEARKIFTPYHGSNYHEEYGKSFDDQCLGCGILVKAVAQALANREKQVRGEERRKCSVSFKRLVKIFLGEEAEIEFSKKLAKGWDNLMKFMDKDEEAIRKPEREGGA